MTTRPQQSIHSHQRTPFTPSPDLSDTHIASLCSLIISHQKNERAQKGYAAVKTVLLLLGAGAAISSVFLAPNSAVVLQKLLPNDPQWEQWKQFNTSYLKRTLKRLEQQNHVEITRQNNDTVVTLTQSGKRKVLKFALENLEIDKPLLWDKKWRMVIYDIPSYHHGFGDLIREDLRALGFYPLQKSVYLHPFPCYDQIEFLRAYYGLGNNLQYVTIEKIENDYAYKAYFGLS